MPKFIPENIQGNIKVLHAFAETVEASGIMDVLDSNFHNDHLLHGIELTEDDIPNLTAKEKILYESALKLSWKAFPLSKKYPNMTEEEFRKDHSASDDYETAMEAADGLTELATELQASLAEKRNGQDMTAIPEDYALNKMSKLSQAISKFNMLWQINLARYSVEHAAEQVSQEIQAEKEEAAAKKPILDALDLAYPLPGGEKRSLQTELNREDMLEKYQTALNHQTELKKQWDGLNIKKLEDETVRLQEEADQAELLFRPEALKEYQEEEKRITEEEARLKKAEEDIKARQKKAENFLKNYRQDDKMERFRFLSGGLLDEYSNYQTALKSLPRLRKEIPEAEKELEERRILRDKANEEYEEVQKIYREEQDKYQAINNDEAYTDGLNQRLETLEKVSEELNVSGNRLKTKRNEVRNQHDKVLLEKKSLEGKERSFAECKKDILKARENPGAFKTGMIKDLETAARWLTDDEKVIESLFRGIPKNTNQWVIDVSDETRTEFLDNFEKWFDQELTPEKKANGKLMRELNQLTREEEQLGSERDSLSKEFTALYQKKADANSDVVKWKEAQENRLEAQEKVRNSARRTKDYVGSKLEEANRSYEREKHNLDNLREADRKNTDIVFDYPNRLLTENGFEPLKDIPTNDVLREALGKVENKIKADRAAEDAEIAKDADLTALVRDPKAFREKLKGDLQKVYDEQRALGSRVFAQNGKKQAMGRLEGLKKNISEKKSSIEAKKKAAASLENELKANGRVLMVLDKTVEKYNNYVTARNNRVGEGNRVTGCAKEALDYQFDPYKGLVEDLAVASSHLDDKKRLFHKDSAEYTNMKNALAAVVNHASARAKVKNDRAGYQSLDQNGMHAALEQLRNSAQAYIDAKGDLGKNPTQMRQHRLEAAQKLLDVSNLFLYCEPKMSAKMSANMGQVENLLDPNKQSAELLTKINRANISSLIPSEVKEEMNRAVEAPGKQGPVNQAPVNQAPVKNDPEIKAPEIQVPGQN